MDRSGGGETDYNADEFQTPFMHYNDWCDRATVHLKWDQASDIVVCSYKSSKLVFTNCMNCLG